MSILSWLGAIGGGLAAPFTGGATLPIALSGISDIAGGAAKSGQAQNNTNSDLLLKLANAKLNQQKFAEAAPSTRLGTGIRASIAANYTPRTLDWGPNGFKPGAIAAGNAQMPTFKGGVAGGMANLNPDTKALANQITHDELVSQMQGGASAPGGGTDRSLPAGTTDIGKSSTSDNILGGVSMGSSILALLSKLQGGNSGNPSDYGISPDWANEGMG